MAEYRRFVAYIYEYVNGRKNRNAGFAKVESRNHICRIQIHIQNLTLGEGAIEIFGFIRENDGLQAVRLGEGQVQNGSLDCRITTPEETVGGSDYGFCQMKGIWLRSESGRNWATVFDDEPLDMAKLGRTEKAPADHGQEEAAQERRELSEETELPEQERTEPSEGTELPEQERTELSEGTELPEQERTEFSEGTELPEQERTEPSEGTELPEQERTELSEGLEIPEMERTEEKQEESERKKEEITEAEIAEQKPADQAEKRRCAAGSDRRWKCVTANYPHFQPVSDDTVTDAIRIQPSDLRILWQKGWKQGNNSFLMHGFYRYRYLMLGKCSDGRYILGVPGIYEEQEQNMAKLFGFPEFKPVEGALDNQRFGYWCRYLD